MEIAFAVRMLLAVEQRSTFADAVVVDKIDAAVVVVVVVGTHVVELVVVAEEEAEEWPPVPH